MKKNRKIIVFIKAISVTLVVAVAVVCAYFFLVRSYYPTPKSSADFTSARDYDISAPIGKVPDKYWKPAARQGTIHEVYYQGKTVKKRAIVYLPYGYDPEKKYDIVYFQGGSSSTETRYFGTPDKPGKWFRNVLDNLIMRGDMKPVIGVCSNFYDDIDAHIPASQYEALYKKYIDEIRDILIPLVESRYSTFADSVTPEAITASRGHRAFCGFSMGAAITWRVFETSLDYFSLFVPNCGGMQNPYTFHLTTDYGQQLEKSVARQGYTKDDFFIYCPVGSLDLTYNSTMTLINDLYYNCSDTFVFTRDNTKNGNITFKKMPFMTHSFYNATRYYYNALPALFPNK